MPGLTRTPQSFWKYEHDKHGACKVRLWKLAGATETEEELMVLYFEQIVKLYDQITGKFNFRTDSFNGQSDLARAMGVEVDSTQVSVVIFCSFSKKETWWRSISVSNWLRLVLSNPWSLLTVERGSLEESSICQKCSLEERRPLITIIDISLSLRSMTDLFK